MKNRVITVAVMAFVMGSTIQLVTAQVFQATIPCQKEADCQNDRLPENAHCNSGRCVCPKDAELSRFCSEADIRETPAETPPPTSTTAQPSSWTQSPPKSSNSSSRTAEVDSAGCPTPCPTHPGFCNSTRKQCDCLEGFVMAVDNTECLPVGLELGSNCTQKEQCQKHMEHTTCEDEQCICEENYHETSIDQCWQSKKLGEACNNPKDCSHVMGATCDTATGVCKCLAGNTPNVKQDECLAIANNYRDTCRETPQCLAKIVNSVCFEKTCECLQTYHFNETLFSCVFYPSLGQTCKNDYECDQGEEQGAPRFQLCENKICTCRGPFYPSGNICTDGAASLVPGFLTILAAIFLFSRH